MAIAALLLAACGAANPALSQGPTVAPSPTIPAPTDFAAWTARQGFGGSSGLNEIHKLVTWVGDNPGEVTPGMLDVEDVPVVVALAAWLDGHPPTSCWAAFHDATRADLATIEEGYATIRASVSAGRAMPVETQARMEQVARQALERPTPADCP